MSKREQQKKIKEQKQAAAEQRDRAKKIGLKVFTFAIAPALLVLVLYTLFTQGPTYSPVEISDSDHIRGTAENSVTIVVYADFQCPACATEHQAMTQLWPLSIANVWLLPQGLRLSYLEPKPMREKC